MDTGDKDSPFFVSSRFTGWAVFSGSEIRNCGTVSRLITGKGFGKFSIFNDKLNGLNGNE